MIEPANSHTFEKIYIDRRVEFTPVVKNVMERIDPRRTELIFVDNPESVRKEHRDSAGGSLKGTLLIEHYSGNFLTACPGSDGVVCCKYYVIDTGPGCIYDCHYCFLQTFLNTSLLSLYGNTGDILKEIRDMTSLRRGPIRIGSGEYTDSLALDSLTGFASILVKEFAGLESATLELKTKSDSVDSLLNLEHRGKTVVSWSLNPPGIVSGVEEFTATLERRLEAARKVQNAGYPLGFHLDPMFYYPGWERDYRELLDLTFSTVDSSRIAWISLGGFRYSPGMPEIIEKRFPGETITHAEMIQGSDGKYRYFKSIREEMYRTIRNQLLEKDPDLFVYLCMDTRHMWKRVFGNSPENSGALDEGFTRRLEQIRRKERY